MIDLEISEVRKFTKIIAPTADFEALLTFYNDNQ